jgi:sterol desaturase/sphingolipid hydroxylase (fatty acid hydroxylase superfamily)
MNTTGGRLTRPIPVFQGRLMHSPIFAWFAEHYHWRLSLLALALIAAVTLVGKRLFMLVPTFRAAADLNEHTRRKRMEKPVYQANQKMNRKWGLLYQVVIFGVILPFCLTLDPQPLWRMLLDVVVILLFYDFVYYITHRFLFHHSPFFGGPLVWCHAVHHQQHNPCRQDSGYLHPLETAIGLGLYVGTIFLLSRFMGNFHVATVVITFVAFTQINLHNHDLWTQDRFPFRYLNYASRMHHNHHARFTGGNFATITLLYDWMFGTLDNGKGYKKVEAKAKASA